MKADQVDRALHQKFITDGARLVFWHDPNEEFADYVAKGLGGDLHEVTVVDVAERGGLPTKLLLEREDPTGRYLIYRKGARPPVEEDWLFDIRLYSVEFRADVASIWLEELGLGGLYLRDHLAARATFLGNQERRRKLAQLVGPSDDEASIDLAMMAVITASQIPNLFSILRRLCHAHARDGHFDLTKTPGAIELFDKMGLTDRFWANVRETFGYHPAEPTMAGLLRRLLVSELLFRAGPIHAFAHLQLPPAGCQNALVCLTQWRDSSGLAETYDAVAKAIAHEQQLGEHLQDLPLDALASVFTFWHTEQRVVSMLKARVLEQSQAIDVDAVTSIATERKAGHWLTGPGSDSPKRRAISDAYDAIVAAAQLFALRTSHQNRLSFGTPEQLLAAYREELYRFDQLYRRFSIKAGSALEQNWDLLKALTAEVERVYDQGFLQPLGVEWSRLLDAGFLERWKLEDMSPQPRFYDDNINPYLEDGSRRRAYVIISDALRYEAAEELLGALNGRYRMNATLGAMLGVLPSYTSLGMASLLPHRTLSYTDKGDVLVDGKSVATTESRSKQLSTVNGMACQAKALRMMKLDEARDFTRGRRVVYIYHNVIDARGDTASTESEAFEAVEKCIEELVELTQFCVNKLNAAKVWITADHGFLFQQSAPGETDKSELSYKPEHAVKLKKRYVMGRDLGKVPEAHFGSTRVTARTEDPMDFWVPRGTNRFHFSGGARFVHGGAMPQEVVVPLLTVTQLRGKKKAASRTEKVTVQVLGNKHKITTARHRFELIQTEAVGERRKPITLRAAVYDGADAVTSVDTVTFDSTSQNMEERKRSIRLTLSSAVFDKAKPYRLVLRDAETDAEIQSIPVVIDRSFDDDF